MLKNVRLGLSRVRSVRAIALVVLALACVGGALWYRHLRRYRHFAVHHHGHVYRSGWLKPDVLADVIEDYQIRTVVNLCSHTEMTPDDWRNEREVVAKNGAELVEIQMPVMTRLDDDVIRKFVALLGDPDRYPMLVHCQHGVTRTDKLLVIYDIAYRGRTADESLNAMPLFGRDEHNVHVQAFARQFEKQYRKLYPKARPQKLSQLHQ